MVSQQHPKSQIRSWRGAACRVLIGLGLLAASTLAAPQQKANAEGDVAPATVVVDLRATVVDSFMGLGIQLDPYDVYRPDAKKWAEITARIDDCRPGLFRMCHRVSAYCLGLDASDKPIYVWDAPAQEDAKQRDALEQIYAILDYAQSRGVNVVLGEWGAPGR